MNILLDNPDQSFTVPIVVWQNVGMRLVIAVSVEATQSSARRGTVGEESVCEEGGRGEVSVCEGEGHNSSSYWRKGTRRGFNIMRGRIRKLDFRKLDF